MSDPTNVHSRLNIRTTGGLPGVVLQPNGLKLGPGVFPTLREAINAIKSQFPGQAAELAVAPQGGPWEVEAGTYDFDNGGQPIILTNGGLKLGEPRATMLLAEGVVFTGFTAASGINFRKEEGATPVFDFLEAPHLVDVGMVVAGAAAGPMVLVHPDGGGFRGERVTIFTSVDDVPVMDFSDAGPIQLYAYDHSTIGPDTLTFAPGKTLRLFADNTVLIAQDNGWPNNVVSESSGNGLYGVEQVPVSERSVLSAAQLAPQASGGSVYGAVRQAAVFWFNAQPTAAQTVVVTDGDTTETYTAVAGAPSTGEFQIGGSAEATLANLVDAILSASALWGAAFAPTLKGQWGTAGGAAVLYRLAQNRPSYPDRLYGSAANGRVVRFPVDQFLYYGSAEALPSTDPGLKRFFGYGSNSKASPGQVVVAQAERQLLMAAQTLGALSAASVGWTWLAGRNVTPIKTAAFTARPGDIVQVNPTAGGFTVTMPVVGPGDNGAPVTVKNTSSSTNTVTIAAGAGATIESGGNLAAASAASSYYYDPINAVWRLQALP